MNVINVKKTLRTKTLTIFIIVQIKIKTHIPVRFVIRYMRTKGHLIDIYEFIQIINRISVIPVENHLDMLLF